MKPLLGPLDRGMMRDGVQLIAGNLGAGKTYTAVRLACELGVLKSRPVWTNFPLRESVCRMALSRTFGEQAARAMRFGMFSMLDEQGIQAIPRYPRDGAGAGAIVVLDEVLLYHAEVEAVLNDIIVQARKRRWMLFLLAQSPDALPRKYRMLTSQYLRTVYAPFANTFGLHLVDRRIQAQRAARQIVMRKWHTRNRLWSLAYDSWYEFPSRQGLQSGMGEKGVPHPGTVTDDGWTAYMLDQSAFRLKLRRE